MSTSAPPSPGTYAVRTFGCQMNVHDSERIAGLLDGAGWTPQADGDRTADLVVINTCAVREKADEKLYNALEGLRPEAHGGAGPLVAVGGCLAQKDGAHVVERAPWVDVVFGTHNVHRLPVLLERARVEAESQVELAEALEVFPSTLPARRESPYRAWVSISVGCSNTCTFCIVPSLRGVERDRRPGEVLAEVEALVADGVVEVTLLGQNVNSYGREFREPGAFADLLRALGPLGDHGLERVRFTSPHPRDFTDDVLHAMAETPVVCPQLHLPLQSGSDAVLRRMRRSYRRSRYEAIVRRAYEVLPDAALTTDVIVGFPGETEDDFAQTLEVVAGSRFSTVFMFQYSPRPGTPAASYDDQVPREVIRERYARLEQVVRETTWESHRAWGGREVEVLLAEGEGRKDHETGRSSGRARDGRLVHLRAPEGARPGDLMTTVVTDARPTYLVADGAATSWRRTRGGDAWQARQDATVPVAPSPRAVGLGMPSVGVPPPLPAAVGCG